LILLRVQKKDGPLKEVPLNSHVLTIGKSRENNLVLKIPSISRFHCEIHRIQGGLLVRDLGSRNGTFVEGVRLQADQPVKHGDRIQLGEYILTIIDADQAKRLGQKPLPLSEVSDRPQAQVRSTAGQNEPQAGAAKKTAIPEQLIPPQLRKVLHQDLLSNMNLQRLDISKLSQEEIRHKTEGVIREIIVKRQKEIPAHIAQEILVKDVLDQALGLGPLEDLLRDPDINEIMVNRFDRIYVERNGKLELTGRQFIDDQHVLEVIRRIIAPIGRRIDESSPMVDARLADGSRVNAIIAPLAISGPSLTIRKFAQDPFSVADMVRFGTLTGNMAKFLELCVMHRKNLCISGGTGSGKTTLLNLLASFIPIQERIVTIEDAAELRLPQDHVVSLESKPPNIEGEGAIPIRKLVINSLRMRPDRIIIGECRGGEALDMLQAMNTGHDGSLTTLHANSCRDALSRLETMVMMAGMDLPAKAILEQISAALDIIVQTSRYPDGSRKVTSIMAVTGMEGEVITLQEIFSFQQSGYDAEGKIEGKFVSAESIPEFIHDLINRGIEIDLGIFKI